MAQLRVRKFALLSLVLVFLSSCKTFDRNSGLSNAKAGFTTADSVQSVYAQTTAYQQYAKERYDQRKSLAYLVKIASYNLGLLDDRASLATGAYVPEYDVRRNQLRRVLGKFLQDNNPHFLCLQELFYAEDVSLLTEIANKNGYGIISNPSDQRETGTAILYRKKNLKSLHLDRDFLNILRVGGPFYPDRSVIGAAFTLKTKSQDGIKVLVASAHLSYAEGSAENNLRLEEISKMTETLKQEAERSHSQIILLGADFNLSPIIGDQVYKTGKGVPLEQRAIDSWQENTTGYYAFFNHMLKYNPVDTWYAANPLSEEHQKLLVIPDQNEDRKLFGFSEDPVESYLTKVGRTTKKEPAQRLDYIWSAVSPYTELAKRYSSYTQSSRLIFTEPLSDSRGESILYNKMPLHLSDHFGVMSEVIYTQE